MRNKKKVNKDNQTELSEDDLYKILPRFVDEEFVYDYIKGLLHKPIQREFKWKGEICQLIIIPGFVADEDGQHRNYFPGPQEQQVETALIELARENKIAFFDGKKTITFTLKQLEEHLATVNVSLSQKQIERSIRILASADFTICAGDHRWMFRLIDTLATYEEESAIRLIAYLGDLITEEIKKYKLHQ